MARIVRQFSALALIATMAGVASCPALASSPLPDPTLVERAVKPSLANPAVRQFDDSSIAVSIKGLSADAPLVIFLPGTNGRPQNVRDLLGVVARLGYRVVALEYDDKPAVVQVCPRDPDPACSAQFRQMRIDGTGSGVNGVSNPVAESIDARLVAALSALDKAAPGEGWGGYLGGGVPRWDRIVVSGLSQGAGMAAFIAKRHLVRRVVLFSSPWDFTLPGRRLAPWIDGNSVTPPERWFAEYHRREATADLLAQAYRKLAIPPDHVLVFDHDLTFRPGADNANPFHGSTVRDIGYAPRWRVLFGEP